MIKTYDRIVLINNYTWRRISIFSPRSLLNVITTLTISSFALVNFSEWHTIRIFSTDSSHFDILSNQSDWFGRLNSVYYDNIQYHLVFNFFFFNNRPFSFLSISFIFECLFYYIMRMILSPFAKSSF